MDALKRDRHKVDLLSGNTFDQGFEGGPIILAEMSVTTCINMNILTEKQARAVYWKKWLNLMSVEIANGLS